MDDTKTVLEILSEPFWRKWDFWIFVIIGILGLAASILAFFQAKRAKEAACQAATTVKIQTIVIELTEIVQKLDKLDVNISFSNARDFLNELSRKIIRLLAPFKETQQYSPVINNIFLIIKNTRSELEKVKPIDSERRVELTLNSVYHAIELNLSELSQSLAEIIGLFEKRTLKNE